MSRETGQTVRRVSLPAPISPTYNFASAAITSQGRPGRKVSVRPGSIFERNGTEERKLSVVWARHTPGSEKVVIAPSLYSSPYIPAYNKKVNIDHFMIYLH